MTTTDAGNQGMAPGCLRSSVASFNPLFSSVNPLCPLCLCGEFTVRVSSMEAEASVLADRTGSFDRQAGQECPAYNRALT